MQRTALHIASQHKWRAELCQDYSTVQQLGLTGQMMLAQSSNQHASSRFLTIVKLLLRYGASVKAVDDKLKTPLHLACE